MFNDIVRVNLCDYKIVIKESIHNGLAIGLCDYSKKEIHIEIGPLVTMESTYHHELGHAVAHEYGPILSQMDKDEQYAELVRIGIDCMFEANVLMENLKEEYEREKDNENN